MPEQDNVDPIVAEPIRRYAAFDPVTGDIQTCYDDSIHGGAIPPDALEMTDAQFIGHINNAPRLAVNVLLNPPEFVEAVTVEPTLDEIKADGKARVLGWINSLTQQMREGYAADEILSWPGKAPQARALVADNNSAPGALILGEAGITGQTPLEVAQAIVALADVTELIMGKVTGVRRMVMADIDAAIDAAGVEAAIATGLQTATVEAVALGLSVPT